MDAACPVSTGGGTRRFRLVRGGGRGGGAGRRALGAPLMDRSRAAGGSSTTPPAAAASLSLPRRAGASACGRAAWAGSLRCPAVPARQRRPRGAARRGAAREGAERGARRDGRPPAGRAPVHHAGARGGEQERVPRRETSRHVGLLRRRVEERIGSGHARLRGARGALGPEGRARCADTRGARTCTATNSGRSSGAGAGAMRTPVGGFMDALVLRVLWSRFARTACSLRRDSRCAPPRSLEILAVAEPLRPLTISKSTLADRSGRAAENSDSSGEHGAGLLGACRPVRGARQRARPLSGAKPAWW
jgi:hypothetical protein